MQRKKQQKKMAKGSSRQDFRGNLPPSADATSIPALFQSRSRIRYSVWDASPKSISTSASVATGGALSFQASSVADTGILTATDAYRILSVDLVFIPNSETGASPASATAGSGIWTCFDPDDNVTVGVVTVASSSTATVHSMFERWTMTIRPRPSNALYAGGAFSGYAIAEREPWIDTVNLSVPHYGWKWAAPVTSTACSGALYVRYNLECIQPQ